MPEVTSSPVSNLSYHPNLDKKLACLATITRERLHQAGLPPDKVIPSLTSLSLSLSLCGKLALRPTPLVVLSTTS